MREILFRGKRVDNGEWVEGFLVVVGKLYYILTGKVDITKGVAFERFEVIPETVGQYTGLTDKNDVRIFEGDILVDNPDNKVCNMFEIAWFDSLAGFMLDDGIIAYNTIGFLETPESNKMLLENIGNIHDNPELLEVSGDD